jgi:hypothetical protein
MEVQNGLEPRFINVEYGCLKLDIDGDIFTRSIFVENLWDQCSDLICSEGKVQILGCYLCQIEVTLCQMSSSQHGLSNILCQVNLSLTTFKVCWVELGSLWVGNWWIMFRVKKSFG